MAAYAAVVCLMNIMEQIRNHPRLSTCFNKNQIESLGEKLDFFLAYIESSSSHGGASEEVEDLERQIASAAHSAEDVIESHVVDQIHGGFAEKSRSFLIDLQKIIQDMSLIKEEVVAKFKEERLYKATRPTYSAPAASSRGLDSGKTPMVGFDDVLLQLLDRLTGYSRDLEVIPIVGPAGIGKTTLARNAFQNSLVGEHFDFCAWVTVSQEFNIGEALLPLLSSLEFTDKLVHFSENEAGVQLHKILYGRRYLIILDDMWSIESWDVIKLFLPDINNGSRIIVTTRLSSLASYFGSNLLVINFLDENQSWELFCKTVFAYEVCPPELEELGKVIVRYCKGLPLSITVIGGLLRKSSMIREYWEHVAKNIGSILNSDENNQMQNVLMLSYNALPSWLKPCFLYVGIFPKDHEFRVSRIIKLWVAEGFLKPRKDQTLEDVGEGCINELIDRNLILVSSKGSNGKPKICKIHDLLRDLCIRLADKEKFLSLVRKDTTPGAIKSERRFAVHDSTAEKYKDPQFFHAMESTLLARSLIRESPALLSFKSRLLRLLIEVYSDSLETTFQQVNLRFLAYESVRAPMDWILTYELSPSISLLWNVQTLIIDKKIEEVVAPSEIWEMPQLRHLDFNRIHLPDPPPASADKDDLVLQNLQTLGTVVNFNCNEEVCKRMPNIKKLRVLYDDFSGESQRNSWYCIDNVGRFDKLESLYYCFHRVPNRDDLLQNLKFPHSLRKLILQDCELHWNDLSIIGSLPNLEVLKLRSQSVRGPKWETSEGEFPSLKMLEIDSCYLLYWFSDCEHFPSLEKLVLRGLYRLNEIPLEIGDVEGLEEICVVECSISAAISAVRILDEQESLGRDRIQVRVRFRKEKEVAEFTAKVETEGLIFTSALQIDAV